MSEGICTLPIPEVRMTHGKGRGFKSMSTERQRELASKGGKAAHEKGTGHEFDSAEAKVAGRKGGLSVSKNREHMAAIGRLGGEKKKQNRKTTMVNTPPVSIESGEGWEG